MATDNKETAKSVTSLAELIKKQKAAMQRHVKKKANESKQNIDFKENS